MKCSIGLDFGTLSVRCLLLDIDSGNELALSEFSYPHGVMDERLPSGVKLGIDFALQDPADYLEGLETTIKDVLRQTGVPPGEIIGIGVDFTACTILPIDRDGVPLCSFEQFKDNPQAYVKLWKHHAAQEQASEMVKTALERGEDFLKRYGGSISSEWLFPKVLETYDLARDVYDATDRFIEACDWIVFNLTGIETRNSNAAGFKAFWDKDTGSYPGKDYFEQVRPGFAGDLFMKVKDNIHQTGTRAGGLTKAWADKLGLPLDLPVAVGVMDAHAGFPSLGITEPGYMMMIIGTSTCHEIMVQETGYTEIPGMCGVVRDGLLPGFNCYEMGQSGVGDSFQWFAGNATPAAYLQEAQARGISLHKLLNEKAALLKPGQNGLVALDWMNGNRSILNNANLSGVIAGLTLQTKPEEIYRALIEATAFGTRKIIETFKNNGLAIKGITACGGISEKSPLTMQIYADVTGMPIRLAASQQAAARGAAIYGAVAANQAEGLASIFKMVQRLGKTKDLDFKPDYQNQKIYDQVYAHYNLLHDFFGLRQNELMKQLKDLKKL